MEKEISIKEWVRKFDNGEFDANDVETQCDAGWYDWFCRDTSLRNKTYKLAPKIKEIAKILGDKFCEKHYLFFKNNCPMSGSLYDDFRFCSIKTRNVIYTITPSSGFNTDRGEASVWGKSNDFKEPLVTGTWKDVVNYFKSGK